MTIRRCSDLLLLALGLCLAAAPLLAGEGGEDGEEEIDPYANLKKWRQDQIDQYRANKARYIADGDADIKKLEDTLREKEKQETTYTTDTQDTGEKVVEFTEPSDPAEAIGKPRGTEVSVFVLDPNDFTIHKHEIWKLKPGDFYHYKPAEVIVQFGHLPDKVYFVVPYRITNSDPKARRISPRVWIVDSNLRFTAESGGLIVKQASERSLLRELNSSVDLAGYVRDDGEGKFERVGFFKAGETRQGVAIFRRFSQEMDEMKVCVDGLDNCHKYDKGLRRVLVLNFARPGDQYYPQMESLVFKGQDFEWVWNWHQEIDIETPSRMTIETASGQREKALWYYRYKLRNRTGAPQEIKLMRFDTIVKVGVDLSVNRKGVRVDPRTARMIEKAFPAKTFSGKVEVRLVDDGDSNIHKAKVMREIGVEFKADRLFKGTLADGRTHDDLVVFDEADIDFEPIYAYIEDRLNSQGFETTLENPQKVEDFFARSQAPVIDLTKEEKKEVRTQVLEGIADSLSQQHGKKLLVAEVTARAGVASGTFTIRRHYVKRGAIEEGWIHKWEEE